MEKKERNALFFILPRMIKEKGGFRMQRYEGIDVGVDWTDFSILPDEAKVLYLRVRRGKEEAGCFLRQAALAKGKGLWVGGCYVLASPDERTGAREGREFATLLEDADVDCLPALALAGWEDSPERCTGLCAAFLEGMGAEEGMLFVPSAALLEKLGAGLNRYDLWVADYCGGPPDLCHKWASWTGWQYAVYPYQAGSMGRSLFSEDVLLNSKFGKICYNDELNKNEG